MPHKKILLATDYSPAGEQALKVATSLARDTGSRLIIAHVSESELHPVGELFNEEPKMSPREIAQLEAIQPTASSVEYEHRLLFGEPGSMEMVKPADEILKLASEEHVDMIVIGTHGRSGLGRMLMGSVAEHVIRGAACPVVTVKQPSDT